MDVKRMLWDVSRRWYACKIVCLVSCLIAFYVVTQSTISQTKDVKRQLNDGRPCTSTFLQPQRANMEKISSYEFPDVQHYIHELFPEKPVQDTRETLSSPVFVTAYSSNHFVESKRLFENINSIVRRQFPALKVIVYSMDLSQSLIRELLTFCQCEVRQFRFDFYPPHVRVIYGYTWKPLVLQEVAKEHPFVVWMDTSVRFDDLDLRPFFQRAKYLGVVVSTGQGSVAMRTHTKTFEFLNEEPCAFKNATEFQAGYIMLYSNPTVTQYFMKPWVSCALTLGCMFPDYKAREYIGCGNYGEVYFDCHRFDQSILNILIRRLFGTQSDAHAIATKQYHSFCKGIDTSWYLPSFIYEKPLREIYSETCF
ncbi:uncharacterized protein LOC127858518 isoform X2 [Dreissena polymorpha]|uniref:uncharacterized protein LOC127858518 isoform X2 n=1 Tax=Dreissena polymorpha TaxID=45954 RepID=UPI002263F128|nr:uncharacterized protein LOC127858518 isoform X2 [Dreissena polymorpha]